MQSNLSDWLEYYMQFTENTEPPVLYHLWSGIAAISSALRRKCYTDWGHGVVYPNFYICLVGPPGGRKGTAMKKAKPMVQALKIPMGADVVGSAQALYQEITKAKASYKEVNGRFKEHKSISIWSEEFQSFLNDRDPLLMASITDLFDCADVWRYRSIRQDEINVSNCYLTIIGAITPSLLQTKLTLDAIGGGLVSRIIFVVGFGKIKKIAFPLLTDEEKKIQKKLMKDLQQIANLSGSFKVNSKFINHYASWYMSHDSDKVIGGDKFQGYNARRAVHLNKLCMIVSAAENNDMILQPHHFDKALAILEATEEQMSKAFQGFGVGGHAEKLAKILTWIEEQTTFTHIDLLDKFYLDVLPEELSIFMQLAQDRGLVSVSQSLHGTTYKVRKRKEKVSSHDYLNQTVFKRMTQNLIRKANQKKEDYK